MNMMKVENPEELGRVLMVLDPPDDLREAEEAFHSILTPITNI
jgi:hypothetical protein